VLIVDDEPTNLVVLGELLTPHYRVLAAPSGEEALRLVARQPCPDLVLLDVMMPALDGFEVLRRLKADPATREIPVIFVTALDDEADEQRGFELGAVDFVHKPIRGLVMLSRVRTQLEASAARELARHHALKLSHQLEEGATALQQAERQLVHSERLAAMGVLAAGVVHEINNPIAFIDANLHAISDFVGELLERVPPGASVDALKADLGSALSDSREGVRRVRQIVVDLKNFSRAGGWDWEWADLHRGLDSTINLAWGELRRKCQVTKRYGELPDVRCLPAQLNQVFMNLLMNAAQAMEHWGEIVVTTRTGPGQTVQVVVADDGKGMPPEVKARLFEAFFTTKPAGEGTGLGLSLSRKIIERHHGRIEVESAPGQGTTFTITLPIDDATRE
jgi:signal transduction histidine kinase